MEEKKAKVVFELDKECVSAACYFLNEKLTDEMWQAIISEELVLDFSDLGDDVQTAKMAFALLAIGKTAEKLESSGQ